MVEKFQKLLEVGSFPSPSPQGLPLMFYYFHIPLRLSPVKWCIGRIFLVAASVFRYTGKYRFF